MALGLTGLEPETVMAKLPVDHATAVIAQRQNRRIKALALEDRPFKVSRTKTKLRPPDAERYLDQGRTIDRILRLDLQVQL
jgi:hypothetical protein